MRTSRVVTLAILAAAAVSTAACGSTRQALGMEKVVPDEFRVVSKAPLVVPPDYALRPPAPGEPRPQELAPESAARNILLGQRQGAARSEGEQLLATRAGGDRADPLARYVVDDEFGDLAHKDRTFAERVMFWRKDRDSVESQAAEAAERSATIDPEAEAARLRALTGGKDIVIRKAEPRFKLPGL